MRVKAIALLISILLVFGLALPAFAATPQENPGKAPSGRTKIVFVHYPKGVMAKGGIPGPPNGGGGGGDDKGGKLWYKYSGVHWLQEGAGPVTVPYEVQDTAPVGYEEAVDISFDTWEDTGASIAFENLGGTFSGVPSSFENPDDWANEVNEIGWLWFSDYGLPGNAIAVTAVWVFTGTPFIAEVDMAMNDDLPWSNSGESDKYDVRNIFTHEAGHYLLLEDLYNKPAREQTMYGYGALGETKKQTLESGDIAGILEIYPAP